MVRVPDLDSHHAHPDDGHPLRAQLANLDVRFGLAPGTESLILCRECRAARVERVLGEYVVEDAVEVIAGVGIRRVQIHLLPGVPVARSKSTASHW